MQFVVAPYEADAQMAYLALRGDVHAVITEDGDLLTYGCPRVRDRAVLSASTAKPGVARHMGPKHRALTPLAVCDVL